MKPLEIGLHVLKAVERGKGGRGKKGGIAHFAEHMGKSKQLYQQYSAAAEVALKSTSQLVDLIEHTQPLSIIHRAPESDWPALVFSATRIASFAVFLPLRGGFLRNYP